MSGKVLCLIFVIYLAQGLAAPQPQPFKIQDLLDELKELLAKAKAALENLASQIESKGEELIEKAKSLIEGVIEKAKSIISKAGACGAAVLPTLDQLNKDVLSGVSNCILAEVPQAIKIAQELKPVIAEITALAEELTVKVEECVALGTIQGAVCLAKLGVEEEPKVKRAINDATPVVEDTIAAIKKLENCVQPRVAQLKNDVDAIVKAVEKCAGN